MEEDKSVKTKIKKVKMKTIDVASLELRKSVHVRLKNRVREIQKLTMAKHNKIMYSENSYEWVTSPPEEHLASLKVSMNNGVGVIVWETYKKDENGDKYFEIHEVINPETGNKMIASMSAVIEKRIIETIEKFKPIDVEVQNAEKRY